MTTDWIVGLDGSPSAHAALQWAIGLALDRNERVTPIAAWHVPFSIAAMAGRRPVDVDRMGLSAEAEFVAGEALKSIDTAGVVDPPRIIEGHPGPALLECSGPNTTVVVGRRGAGALRHRLLGSVSQYLATHSSGPVVVVPETWDSTSCSTIVVGFDGSDHAAAALRWALSIAPDKAEVIALIAVDVVPALRPELVEERYPDEVAAARTRLLAAVDSVDPDGTATREFVLHGARQALAEASGDADLIVVGPRGHGGIGRSLLGSVTSWLLHGAICPVAVVPDGD